MPNMKNAKKRIRVVAKQKEVNNEYKASMRTAIKSVEKAVNGKDKNKATENLKNAIKRIDKAAKAGVISGNTSARHKSSVTKKVNNME